MSRETQPAEDRSLENPVCEESWPVTQLEGKNFEFVQTYQRWYMECTNSPQVWQSAQVLSGVGEIQLRCGGAGRDALDMSGRNSDTQRP